MMHPHAIVAVVSWVLRDARDVIPAAFGAFSQVSAPAAVAALWQGVAVTLTLALFLRLAPRISASHRFAAWAAGFAVLVCLPFLPLFLPLIAHVAAGSQTAAAAPLGVAAAKSWFQLDSRWGFAIAALWFAASLLRTTALGLHSLRLRKLWKTATPIQNDAVLAVIASLRRPVEICTTRHLDRPSVIGFFVPRILIPDWLFARLTPMEFEHVVLHEAEHLRRHDDWINLFQKLALVLFPLNPALAWMERRLCREREMACDEGVVDKTHAPRAYAACLTSLAERGLERSLDRRAQALSLGSWQRRPELVGRVHSILRGKQSQHPLAARALVGVMGCGLLLASVELARCPQMVAFVATPHPHPADLRQIQPDSVPAAYAHQAASGFRASPAKAILPANAFASTPIGDAPVYHAPHRPQPAASSEVATREAAGEPREQSIESNIEAAIPSVAAVANQGAEPQLIVLTAWEAVQTAPQGSRKIADYETGAPAQQQTDATTTRVTVTRLILAIYPVPAAPAPASGSQKASSSQSVRPTAPPAASGWLVFEL
jgi:beta-lactamase regulating signal transducer with metallopeptidase domain